jgi:hypothetical protein
MAKETVTVTLESDDERDQLEVPVGIVELLTEGEESTPTVVGDLAMLGIAQQAHGIVHHSEGEVGEELAEAEETTMELFEERFGQTYAEVTGHGH